jgi:type VII secretion protein EccE
VANLIVLEVGVAIGLILLAVSLATMWIAAGVVVIALILAFTRWNGRWFTQWFGLKTGYAMRQRSRLATPTAESGDTEADAAEAAEVTGPEDRRVSLLRLAVPDLVVAHSMDHERRPVGMAYTDHGWTAVLLVDPLPALVNEIGAAPNLPLAALAPCLEDRGVLLDSIKVVWHCYPGSAALPPEAPAMASYLEVLGPLPAAARRTTWIAVRLDPRKCPDAIGERGGGVVGAHRALIGALSRVRNALEGKGVRVRPLSPEELLRAGISASNMTAVVGSDAKTELNEQWDGVTAAGIGHASYSITGWPKTGNLNALTGVRALSSTVALSISSSADENEIGLSGVVRVSARNPHELADADKRMEAIAKRLGMDLTPLSGLQMAGLTATLPLGGTA